MTPEEQVRRAQRADQFLNDDLFSDALKKLRDEAMESFKTAKTNEDFLKARALYDVTEEFMNAFLGVVRDGEFCGAEDRSRKGAEEAVQNAH